jgi:transposase-like protein
MRPQNHCLLCGAALTRAAPRDSGARDVCSGCAERLEIDLATSDAVACPECGRHQELCLLIPCSVLPPEAAPVPAPSMTVQDRRRPPANHVPERLPIPPRLSGAERVRAIEDLAASRLGVRELSRRTGFAASTISRWLKIDRCSILKHALETGAIDIGRAKLLADAPETSHADLVQVARRMPRSELARHVAALRRQAAP